MNILYAALSLTLPVALAITDRAVVQEIVPTEKGTGGRPKSKADVMGPTGHTTVNLHKVYGIGRGKAPYLSTLPVITLPPSILRAPRPQNSFSWIDLIEANKSKLEGGVSEASEIATEKMSKDTEDYSNASYHNQDMAIDSVPVAITKKPEVTVVREGVFANEVLEARRRKEGSPFSIQLLVGRSQGKETTTPAAKEATPTKTSSQPIQLVQHSTETTET